MQAIDIRGVCLSVSLRGFTDSFAQQGRGCGVLFRILFVQALKPALYLFANNFDGFSSELSSIRLLLM